MWSYIFYKDVRARPHKRTHAPTKIKCLFDRALQGNNEIYKYVVKVEGVLMSPLHVKKEQQLVRVVERRAMTLQEALRSGLGTDEKKVIAFDVSRCLSFLHSKNTAFCNLVPNAVSVS